MSEPSSPEPNKRPRAPRKRRIAISREQFDSIPRKRAGYIVAYGLLILLFYGVRVLLVQGYDLPQVLVTATDIAGIASYFLFYYNFIGALRIMGYDAWVILGTGLASALPIPGVLLVAYMDRRIATAWDAADPGRGGYRQKPPGDAS